MLGSHAYADVACDGLLTGRVFSEREQQPLTFVRIDVSPVSTTSTASEASVGSDHDGRFVVESLCAGTYQVRMRSPGYREWRASQVVPQVAPLNVALTREHPPADVVARPETSSEGRDATAAGAADVIEVIRVESSPIDSRSAQPRSVETLEGEDLQVGRGKDLARLVEQVNGVRSVGAGGIAKPVIRGQVGNRIAILQNGVRHLGQSWGLDHAPEIDPFAADRVTVIQGAAGVAYGPEAVGGVIILDAQPPPSAPGVRGELNLMGATNNGQVAGSTAVRVRLPGWAHRWSMQTQVSYSRSANQVAPRYDIDNTGTETMGISAGAAYHSPSTAIDVSFNRYDATLGIFTGVQSENYDRFLEAIERNEPFRQENYEFSYDIDRPFQTVFHDTIRTSVAQQLTQTSTLSFTYAYQKDKRREWDNVPAYRQRFPQVAFDLDGHQAIVKYQSLVGQTIELSLGGEAEYQDSRYLGTTPLLADYTSFRGGGFGLVRWIQSHYELELGARLDVQSTETSKFAAVNPRSAPRINESYRFVSPTLTAGVIVPASSHWMIRGQLASASRMPSVNELTIRGASPGRGIFETGDPDLGVETTYEASLLVSGTYAVAGINVAVFGNIIDDYIHLPASRDENDQQVFLTTIVGKFPSFSYEAVDASFVGTNVELWWLPWPWLHWRGRASLIRGENLSDDAGLTLVPPDQFENRITIRPFKDRNRLQFFFEHIFTRRQDNADIRQDIAPAPDEYHLFNAGASAEFYAFARPLAISLNVTNIGNEIYRDYLSRLRYYSDEPGIDMSLRLEIPLSKDF